MDTHVVLLDRYPSKAAPRRADARLKIGLSGTLLLSAICSLGPTLSPYASIPTHEIAALAVAVMS